MRYNLTLLLLLFSIASIAQSLSTHPDTMLIQAIKGNNLAQVKSLVDKGANVNAKDDKGASALMWAAEASDLNMVKFLVEHGADINATGVLNEAGGLLHIAAKHCKLDMLKYFVETCKIDVDRKAFNMETGQEDGVTALETAIDEMQTKCVEYLRLMDADTTRLMPSLLSHYYDIGEFQKLIALSDKVEAQLIKEKGMESEDYLFLLNTIALGYHEIGEYETAIELYLKLLKSIENLFGKESEGYISVLGNLASLYHEIGKFDKSLNAYQEVQLLSEKAFGKESFDYGLALNNFSVVYDKIGDYEKALSYILAAIEISEKVSGKESYNYAIRLINLGNIYGKLGEYNKSLIAETEAIDIIGNIRGTSHPDYGILLGNIATTYNKLGEYDKELLLLKEALAITEKSKGRIHQNTSSIISKIGLAHQRMGNHDKALEYLQEAAEISKEAVGENHSIHADNLHNLAYIYSALGENDKALKLYQSALKIKEEQLGKEHNSYIGTLSNLGNLYRKMGDHDQALKLLMEALQRYETVFGSNHPKCGIVLGNLAMLYEQTEDYKVAGEYWFKMNNNLSFQIQNLLPTLNENLQAGYLKTLMVYFDRIHSFILNNPENEELSSASGYNNQLLLKGLLLENQGNLLASLRNQKDSVILLQYQEWQSMQRILARQYMKSKMSQHAFVDSLKNEVEKLEVSLANNSSIFRKNRSIVEWKAVQQNLKAGEAAVEFNHFNYYDSKGQRTDSVVYVGYVTKSNSTAPELIYLFEEKEMEALVNNQNQRRSDYVADLYAIPDRGATAVTGHQKTLYELIWQPLEESMDGIKSVYFAPSGSLHRINLSAIPLSYDQTLGDVYNFHPLGNTRSLTYNTADAHITNNEAVLFGGIQFDMDSVAFAAANMEQENSEPRNDASSDNEDFIATRGGGATWQFLPGTLREIKNIQQTLTDEGFKVNMYEGNAASEEHFQSILKREKSPRILHLATHGYFFADPAKQIESDNSDADNLIPAKSSEHPMVRSGLILAGANHTWQGNPRLKGFEDGILTAYEISQLDLSDTELVCLSACETGLGDITGNEGVYGLQRAFKIAGAKYVIMSLWQVPDKQSSKLMSLFYSNWLGNKMTIEDAFSATQKEMKELYEEPYFWAGFVLIE